MIKWVLILTLHMGDPFIDLVAYSDEMNSLKACQLAGTLVKNYFHADPNAAKKIALAPSSSPVSDNQ